MLLEEENDAEVSVTGSASSDDVLEADGAHPVG